MVNGYGSGDDTTKEVPQGRKSLVESWLGKIEGAKKHHEKPFKRMKDNMALAARGASPEWVDAGKYVVPIVNRHINQSVAQLYAKNPTAIAKRRRKLMHTVWDGSPESLQQAVMAMDAAAQTSAQSGMPPAIDPMAAQLLQEVAQVRDQNLMLDRMGETVALLWDYYLGEQEFNYEQQLKALVRRTKVTGVGYLKIGFQRLFEQRPDITGRIEDDTTKMRRLEMLLEDAAEDKIDETFKEMEQLRLLLADLQSQKFILAREGVVFDFPKSTEIIIDPACRHLKSLAGARWAAQEFEMTAEKVREVYDVDIKLNGGYKEYHQDGKPVDSGPTSDEKTVAKVYEVWDKQSRQWMTVVEGYCDFVKAPAAPDVQIERFWPIFPLVFNEIEHDTELYPPSDVENARHIQEEYNRSREALREHRIAARPYYLVSPNVEEMDRKRIANHAAHEMIVVPAITEGQKADDFVKRGPTAPIDPNLYEVEMHYSDMLRVVGSQEANLGGTAGGTATESSIAEQSRSISLADNVDDLDKFLTDVARAFGQISFTELSKETVVEIVGPGAVWPDMPQGREEAAKELMLVIKAGSSGRPNKAADLANLERGMPFLLQLPGVNPTPLAEEYAELLDLDLEDMIREGSPSIIALNTLMGRANTNPGAAETGNPASNPASQGAAGASNAPNPRQQEPGPQPAFPAPVAAVA